MGELGQHLWEALLPAWLVPALFLACWKDLADLSILAGMLYTEARYPAPQGLVLWVSSPLSVSGESLICLGIPNAPLLRKWAVWTCLLLPV